MAYQISPPQAGVVNYQGVNSALNITAATVVKAQPGMIATVAVIAVGSTAGSVNDCTTTGAVATSNQAFAIPASAAIGSIYTPNFPCQNGIVVTPGTGGTLAVSFT